MTYAEFKSWINRRTSFVIKHKRIIIALVVVIILVLAALIREGVLEKRDSLKYEVPGRMVSVHGESMHIYCTGTGSPTVLLESGLGDSSAAWVDIQPLIASHTRVCSYDRPGYGWSAATTRPRDAATQASDLQELLIQSGENGPYIIVAHSIGGHVARVFTHRHESLVQALVLIDPTDEQAALRVGQPIVPQAMYSTFAMLARLGVMRTFGETLIASQSGTELPQQVLNKTEFLYRPLALQTASRELSWSLESAQQVKEESSAKSLGALPLLVVTPDNNENYDFATGLSSSSTHLKLPNSSHYVHYDHPQEVSKAIRDLLVN